MFTVRNSNEIGPALDGIAVADVGAVNVLASPMLNGARRQTVETHLLERDTDIRIIQALLGHAKLDATARYTRVATGMIAIQSSIRWRRPASLSDRASDRLTSSRARR
jgi:site-specific recombinase XerC